MSQSRVFSFTTSLIIFSRSLSSGATVSSYTRPGYSRWRASLSSCRQVEVAGMFRLNTFSSNISRMSTLWSIDVGVAAMPHALLLHPHRGW